MKWRGRRSSANIEDRRGHGFGRGRMGMSGRGGVKVGGLGVVAIVVLGLIFGIDPSTLLGIVGGDGGGYVSAPPTTEAPNKIDDTTEEFVAVVLADTEEVWASIFTEQLGRTYAPPTLVLFSGGAQSGCGGVSAVIGPFYCPADNRVYLDTGFFAVLEQRLGAGGDFARAYVIAHEVGHHVQDELGILSEVNRLQSGGSEREANQLSVRLELQADCLSGVWAWQADQRFASLESGDIEEALNAASRIGDDVLQKQAQGHVARDSFTHGSADQRVRWFKRGFERGDLGDCDTFTAQSL